eukprot:902596_1
MYSCSRKLSSQDMGPPKCSICQDTMINNLKVTQCGHVFHDDCIDCWRTISDLCPICKQDTECTKLYLNLEEDHERDELENKISTMTNTLLEYKQLAMAQSKSIASKSHTIWESELQIKEMKETIAKLKEVIKQMRMEKKVESHTRCTNMCLYPVYECICGEMKLSTCNNKMKM